MFYLFFFYQLYFLYFLLSTLKSIPRKYNNPKQTLPETGLKKIRLKGGEARLRVSRREKRNKEFFILPLAIG